MLEDKQTKNLWQNDAAVEEAMLKSCLLFNNKHVKDKRNVLFQKFVLSLVISGKAKNKTSIKAFYQQQYKELLIDDGRIDAALQEMEGKKMIKIHNDENIELTPKTASDAESYIVEVHNQHDKLIEDIIQKIRKNYNKSFSNETQVRQNIKNCLNYYYEVSGYSFFGIDYPKEVEELQQFDMIAGKGLRKDEKQLIEQIIYAIGTILDNPTPEQKIVLEILARTYITTQIMAIDPLLANFKRTAIANKVFVLDTDVVLHVITKNGYFSNQYKAMISQLINCGCKLYIPQEVITEVYRHGEAAAQRYFFVSDIIDNNEDWVRSELKNLFIEDYYIYRHQDKPKYPDWNIYLSNFYDKEYGEMFTRSVIEHELGSKIYYGKMPPGGIIDEELKDQLIKITLEATISTEKALHRKYDRNEEIATTDTLLYLTVKSLNEKNERENRSMGQNGRPDLLMYKYYVLTKSTRIFRCADEMGIKAKVLCNPQALTAYLAETGMIEKDDLQIMSLFDNSFLTYTAKTVWNDVETFLKAGIDIKGKNIIKMRYDLQNVVHDILTIESAEKYHDVYKEVTERGYQYMPFINDIISDKSALQHQVDDMILQMAKMKEDFKNEMQIKDEVLEKAKKEIDEKRKMINKNRYLNRINPSQETKKKNRYKR